MAAAILKQVIEHRAAEMSTGHRKLAAAILQQVIYHGGCYTVTDHLPEGCYTALIYLKYSSLVICINILDLLYNLKYQDKLPSGRKLL